VVPRPAVGSRTAGAAWRALAGRCASPLALALALAACDPCFGTAACIEPTVQAEGRLIWLLDGSPAEGVGVEFRPESGSVVMDTLRGISDAEGVFRLIGSSPRAGEVVGTLVFSPPAPYPQFVYGVAGVRVPTTRVRGNPAFVGSWGVGPLRTDPHISYVGELFYRDTGERAERVEVEFRRTGGIAVAPDTFTVHSDVNGRFPLFMTPIGEGEVEGEFEVRPPAPYPAFTVSGVRMQTLIGKDDIRLVGVWAIDR
jgi:hypothetical protein